MHQERSTRKEDALGCLTWLGFAVITAEAGSGVDTKIIIGTGVLLSSILIGDALLDREKPHETGASTILDAKIGPPRRGLSRAIHYPAGFTEASKIIDVFVPNK